MNRDKSSIDSLLLRPNDGGVATPYVQVGAIKDAYDHDVTVLGQLLRRLPGSASMAVMGRPTLTMDDVMAWLEAYAGVAQDAFERADRYADAQRETLNRMRDVQATADFHEERAEKAENAIRGVRDALGIEELMHGMQVIGSTLKVLHTQKETSE